jgi:hypothetical protein
MLIVLKMEIKTPLRIPYEGKLIINYGDGFRFVSLMQYAIKDIRNSNGVDSVVNMQIPLPLHGVLSIITDSLKDKTPGIKAGQLANILGVQCYPSYEARIIVYNPENSFYRNDLLCIIDFEVKKGLCCNPVFRRGYT